MKNYLTCLSLILLSFSLCFNVSYAKRFGGGKSFGAQRSSNFSQARSTVTQKVQQGISSKARSWLGPIAGLMAGGLLASLFMGHGIGSGMISWLVIGLGIFLVYSLIRSRLQPALSTASAREPEANSYTSLASNQMSQHSNVEPLRAFEQSASHFNSEGFLREAKSQFIRLQAAYDQKNLSDIRQFTTPQVFAEIQLQLQERQNAENYTEVVQLDATLLEVSSEGGQMDSSASVRFSGLIKETRNLPPESFTEIWHFQKDPISNAWLVSGLQQSMN